MGMPVRGILLNGKWLLENLRAGLRVSTAGPVRRDAFHVSADQGLILLVLATCAALIATYPFGASHVQLKSHVWGSLGADAFESILVFYAITRVQRAPHTLAAICVVLCSSLIALALIEALAHWALSWFRTNAASAGRRDLVSVGLDMCFVIWFFVMSARGLRLVYGTPWLRTAALIAPLFVGALIGEWLVPADYWAFWNPQQAEASKTRPPQVYTEWTYYAQRELLSAKFSGLSPSRPGVGELYFIGFAGTSTEDVFMKEVRSAQALFDERFDTRSRSLILINNPHTVRDEPIASATNLY